MQATIMTRPPFRLLGCLLVGLALFVAFLGQGLKMKLREKGTEALAHGEPDGGMVAVVCVAAAFAVLFISRTIWWMLMRRGRQHLVRTFEEAVVGDPRPPVLLLRSFKDDERHMLQRSLRSPAGLIFGPMVSLEEALAGRLEESGPVVAIGKPGEKARPLGAVRHYVRGNDWQHDVLRLLEAAQAVVVILGRTRGLQWELQQICRPENRCRTVLVLPPDAAGMASRWKFFLDDARKAGMHCLPEELEPRCAMVTFPAPEKAHFYLASRVPRVKAGCVWKLFGFAGKPPARLYLNPLEAALADVQEARAKVQPPVPLTVAPKAAPNADSAAAWEYPRSQPHVAGHVALLWKRGVAGLIDFGLFFVPAICVAMMGPLPEPEQSQLVLATGPLFLGYLMIFDGWQGRRTLGKRLMNLKTVRHGNATPPGFWRSAARVWLKYTVGLMTLGLVLPLALASRRKRTLYDFAGGTEVISTAKPECSPREKFTDKH
jgi:uncharacterized RDD family membrane protein YckC